MTHTATRARSAFAVLALAALLAQGCGVRGLSFVLDERLSIVSPKENESVTLPFELKWTVENYSGSFLVFFDRSPMRPGQSLDSLAPEGDPCRADPACPNPQWLQDRNIYLTEDVRVVVSSLPERRENNRQKDRHDVTIVYLDDSGKRLGESAFTAEFIVQRED